jgi:hypothetical protein
MTVVVELLLGDIPERSVFRQPIMRKPLLPYFQLTQGQHLLNKNTVQIIHVLLLSVIRLKLVVGLGRVVREVR